MFSKTYSWEFSSLSSVLSSLSSVLLVFVSTDFKSVETRLGFEHRVGRLHPLAPEGRGAWGVRWSPSWLGGDGEGRKPPYEGMG